MNKEQLDELSMMFRSVLKPRGMAVTEYMMAIEIHKSMRLEIERLTSELAKAKDTMTDEQLHLLEIDAVLQEG